MSRLLPTLIPPLPAAGDPAPKGNPLVALETNTRKGVWLTLQVRHSEIGEWCGWPLFRVRGRVDRTCREHVIRTHYLFEDANGIFWGGSTKQHSGSVRVKTSLKEHLPGRWKNHLVATPPWPAEVEVFLRGSVARPPIERVTACTIGARKTLYYGTRRIYVTPDQTIHDLITTNDRRLKRFFGADYHRATERVGGG